MPTPVSGDYERNVFINCPYDEAYVPMLHAVTFTIRWAGFIPRSALEEDDAGTARLERVYRIIDQCLYGIHDMSRIEATTGTGLPRFNMPFECGVFFGARRFGQKHHRRKRLLVLEKEQHQTQQTLSDIAGHDPRPHHDRREIAIERVWSFLIDKEQAKVLPGPEQVADLYAKFEGDLPALADELRKSRIGIMRLDQWKVYVAVVDAFLAKLDRRSRA